MLRGATRWWEQGPVAGAPGMEAGHAFPFSPQQAPHLHRLVADVQRRLGCPEPVELRQQSSLFSGNARILLAPPIELHLFRPALALDEDGIEAQIGHELGHYLVHRTAVCAAPPRLVECALKHDAKAASLSVPYAYAGEITADRFGLLACLDLAGALRLDFVLGTGLLPSAVGFIVKDYLSDCVRTMEALRRAEQPVGGTTHPEHAFRSYALSLFWRSDRFHQLTGLGPGDIALEEADDRIADLLMPGWRAEREATSSRAVEPGPWTHPGVAVPAAAPGAPAQHAGLPPGVGHPATVPQQGLHAPMHGAVTAPLHAAPAAVDAATVEMPAVPESPPAHRETRTEAATVPMRAAPSAAEGAQEPSASEALSAHELAHRAALAEERERRHEAARWRHKAPWDAMGNIEERLRQLDAKLGESEA